MGSRLTIRLPLAFRNQNATDRFRSHLYYIHEASSSQQLAPSTAISHSASSLTNFPIIAIAVIGILATAFLLVSYYVIVIKCCLKATQDAEDALTMHSPARLEQPKGLDQWAINCIPIVEFNKPKTESLEQSLQECSVCLAEFQVNEKLRCLRDCCHLFHMDCIDVWLQNNANCPLCRTSISYTVPSTTHTRQDLTTAETTTCVDTDFVVIEIQTQQLEDPADQPIVRRHPHMPQRVLELRDTPKKQGLKKKHQMLSMGDECIDVRVKDDDVFKIQPMRRSISMDSCNDRQLYLMVQDVLRRQQQKKCGNVGIPVPGDQGCSSGSSTGSRLKRSFFSFGSGRGCKGSAVLPTLIQP
uniref:RING-type E3 ubiquitin transferase n=1 Tax=Kalanchoe fedtschenkoi TaxID=63787 RepID=A0A7N0UUE5_KALFE